MAGQVGRGADARLIGEKRTLGKSAEDRGRVDDRDALAHRRDEARAIGHTDIEGPLAEKRDEVLVAAVLEGHVEPGVSVVAGLVGQVELRELDAGDVAEADSNWTGSTGAPPGATAGAADPSCARGRRRRPTRTRRAESRPEPRARVFAIASCLERTSMLADDHLRTP